MKYLWAKRLALLLVLVGLWQMASYAIDPFFISSPLAVSRALLKLAASGALATNTWITLEETLAGLFIGTAGGIIVGFLLGRSRSLSALLDPFIMALYSLPKTALAPLFILWFGIGIEMKIVLACSIVFFLVFFNTFAGARSVDQELVTVVRLFGASNLAVLFKVVLPAAMNWVFIGIKVAVPYALIGAVVGEIVASNRGIGYLLMNAVGQYDSASMFAVLVVLTIIAILLNGVVDYVEIRLTRWKPL